MISLLKLFCIGVFIGIANVVPGVSGGTIAVICNVYDKLLLLSSLNLKRIKEAWQDILCLALGIGAGIVLFAKVITLLYHAYPTQTTAFFIGIVAGSIPFLFRKVRAGIPAAAVAENGSLKSGWLYGTLCCGAAGFALMLGMLFLQRRGVQAAAVVTVFSLPFAVKLALMGACRSAADCRIAGTLSCTDVCFYSRLGCGFDTLSLFEYQLSAFYDAACFRNSISYRLCNRLILF